ncbi:MAG: efflux transporter outer membrane subunit [Caldimonas sp.]
MKAAAPYSPQAAAIVAAIACAVSMLAGCATPADPTPVIDAGVAPGWLAPRPDPATGPATEWPHGGSGEGLARWWTQFDDPLLARLIDAAEAVSPSVASAGSRIAQARATRAAATAALLPSLDASVSAGRGRQDVSIPLGNTQRAGLQASWELDVFGRNRAGRNAADARLFGAEASWHDARVAVAAETANDYVSLRACEARLAQARLDAGSRAETARLTELSRQAGFESPANAALTRASAAQALLGVKQQGEQCDISVKALVALTAIAEPGLRALLGPAAGRLPVPAAIDVPGVPAAALAQRPDVYARGRDVVAASAEISQAEAARLPRIAIGGSVGYGRYESALGTFSGSTWSLGPVSVSLPIFDAAARRADVVAARARYDAAASTYAATLRGAIREVENALITLQGTADRSADAQTAADDFALSTRATEARYKSGFGTLFELEEARRSALTAQNTLIDLRRERVAAWIALYRALGGGWAGPDSARLAATDARPPSRP